MPKHKRQGRKGRGQDKKKGSGGADSGLQQMMRTLNHPDADQRSSACTAVAGLLTEGPPEELEKTARRMVEVGLVQSLMPCLSSSHPIVAIHAAGAFR